MYLSRVEIDTNNRQKIKDLTHLGAYHHWVEESFPNEHGIEPRPRHLWRIDTLRNRKYLLVLSENQPDQHLLAMYGVENSVQVKAYDRFLSTLTDGEILRFRLTANPTYVVPQSGSARGKVFPHVTVWHQRKWLIEKSTKLGFKFLEAVKTDENTDGLTFDIIGRSRELLHRREGQSVRLSQVTFEGILQITDLDLFRRILTQGIGREKAFGMGLMTVIPEG
jgi:CRISPR system Cascade subunit CasE